MITYTFSKKDNERFQKNKYIVIENFLEETTAKKYQEEILQQSDDVWDRYNNYFENKYTYRDKNNLPKNINNLFIHLSSPEFISQLSELTNLSLQNEPNKLFWGIHVFENHSKLDMHVDAGRHLFTHLIKAVTIGIYLSYDWKEENGGNLEFWSGDPSYIENPKIYDCITSISPRFNQCVIFENNDTSWHGSPNECICNNNEKRIFITMSYLMEGPHPSFKNEKYKALFIKRPSDPDDEEKDKLRKLRANPETCKKVYNTFT
jgi:Rps23 Pro-64 3,4-dihydroxylase Tpa1-like proline 4-hydroxylase